MHCPSTVNKLNEFKSVDMRRHPTMDSHDGLILLAHLFCPIVLNPLNFNVVCNSLADDDDELRRPRIDKTARGGRD